MTPGVATSSGTDEVNSVAATAELLLAAVAEVLLVTVVLTTSPCGFFFSGGADASPELFLFGLLATSAESEVMISDNLTTAQGTNIIIYNSRSNEKAKKEKLQGFLSLVEKKEGFSRSITTRLLLSSINTVSG